MYAPNQLHQLGCIVPPVSVDTSIKFRRGKKYQRTISTRKHSIIRMSSRPKMLSLCSALFDSAEYESIRITKMSTFCG
jgi:hypothetical protein